MKKGIYTLLAALLVLSWLISGCAKQPAAVETTEAQVVQPVNTPVNTTVTVVSWQGSQSLDPTAGLLTDNFVLANLYDSLVRFNPDYTIAPSLAESWTETADSITFKLRSDSVFHDGSKVTVEDVIYSLERTKSQPNNAFWNGVVTTIEKVDENTIKVGKTKPYVKLLEFLAAQFGVVPKALVEADPAKFAGSPVGSGPFKFVSTGADGSITLEANDSYFLGAPQVKKLVILMPMDPATALVAMEKGEIDVFQSPPPTLFSQIEQKPGLKLVKEQGYTTILMALSGEPFISNDKLREAVYHAVNPENVLALGAGGEGMVPVEFFTPKMMGALAGYQNLKDRYNPDLAKQLLAESGYDTSVPISLPASPINANVMTVVQADLAAIGLKVELNQVDMNTYFDMMFKKQLSVFASYLGAVQAPREEILSWFSTQGDMQGFGGKKDPAYDELINQLATEPDAAKREDIMKTALDNLASRYTIVPLYHPNLAVAINSRIENFHGVPTNVYYVNEWKLTK